MSDPIPIQTPGGYAPAFAVGVDDDFGNLSLVARGRPLPVESQLPQAPAPLEGQTTGLFVVGPFEPAAMSPVYCTLSGDWEGTVTILRSTDNGATFHPLTLAGSAWGIFTGNVCEPVWQESEQSASLWLHCTITAGSIAYRLAQ